MTEHHDHHPHLPGSGSRIEGRLLFSIVLNILISLIQVVAGLLANSLALLSDALHNFSDAASLVISYVAVRVSRKPATKQRTFGYKRAEVVASFTNIILLVVVAVLLVKEAMMRIVAPEVVQGKMVLYAAIAGLFANLLTAVLLYRDSKHSLNIRSVFLHIVTDAFASVGVILLGLAILLFDAFWLDPLLSLVVAIYVIWHSMGMLRRTVDILMHATPAHLDVDEISRQMQSIEYVQHVHHVHIWSLDEKEVFFEAHIAIEKVHIGRLEEIKQAIRKKLLDEYGIRHCTLEVELAEQGNADAHCTCNT